MLGGVAASATAHAAPPSSSYKLVFADEFNGASLDPVKWIDAYPWGRTHNHDAYMASSNVILGDGSVTLKAERTAQGGKAFTSGVISTGYSLERFDGGYFEASMFLPTTPGSWPAFWGLDNGWPPEADIMEFPLTTNGGASGYANTDYHTAFHYVNSSGGNSAGAGRVNPSSAGALNTGWHTFGMEWVSDSLVRFYFDGAQVSSFSDATAVSQMTSMYLILNYAVGGWPGTPSLAQWPAGASDATKIDYVRVYQIPATTGMIAFSGTSSSGSWDTASRWSGGVPKYEDQVASFGTNANASVTLDWNQPRTVGGLAFSSTSTSYTVGDAGASLQLARSSGTPSITVAAATTKPQTVASRLELYETTTAIVNDSSQPLWLTGTIVGEGNLTIDGSGPVVFANNNTYTGNTSIDSGAQGPAVARVTRSTPFGSGTVSLGPSGNATTARIEVQDNRTIPNRIVFSGRNNASVGLVNLSGTNTFLGTVSAGVSGGSYAISADGGLMKFSGADPAAGGVALTTHATGNRTFTLMGAGQGEISGSITNGTGMVHLAKLGTGTWTVSGSSTFTGTTSVQEGTLRVTSMTALASSPIVVQGGTLAPNQGLMMRTPELRLAGGVVQGTSMLVHGSLSVRHLVVESGGFSATPALTVSGSGRVDCAIPTFRVASLLVDQASGGLVDIAGSRFVVAANGIPQAALVADLQAGRGDGGWNGTGGITSSLAAAATAAGQPRAIGWMDDGTGATVLAVTAPGDTNLDGTIDILDVSGILGEGMFDLSVASTWAQGDFNYDGIVDLLDMSDFVSTALFDVGPFLAASSMAGVASVPEPAMLPIAGAAAGAVVLACRRRSRATVAVGYRLTVAVRRRDARATRQPSEDVRSRASFTACR